VLWHRLYDEFDGLVLRSNQGVAIAESFGQNKGVILCNHGLLTVGGTVDETTWWFIMMERSCHIQLMAEAAGKPRAIDAETARKTRLQLGSPIMGWYAFQPLYDMMEKNQPDFLS
jgi:ribulose-5-phosphate 4-epimerase/fuculose-1-phosphate aldolase